MEIQEIQYTPNPQAIILQVGRSLTSKFQSEEFHETDSSNPDFVNSILDHSDQIDSVMVQENHITLRLKDKSWKNQSPLLKDLAVYVRGSDFQEGSSLSSNRDKTEKIDPKLELIKEVLEEEILPYLKSHGGDISIIELTEDDELIIEYKGACGGCSAAFTGTLQAIQSLLQKSVDPNIDVKLNELPF